MRHAAGVIGVVAFASAVYGLWSYPLGLPALNFAVVLTALVVMGFAAGWRPHPIKSLGVGAAVLVAFVSAWVLTTVVDPGRPGGELTEALWLFEAGLVAIAHLVASVLSASPVERART